MQKIVIVEDDENIRNLIEIALRNYMYEVISFEDGESFLTWLESNNADLLLLDWMLPGISGLDIIKLLRKQEKYNNLAIMMLTAKNSEIDKVQGLDFGADDYLTKPFSVMELSARIRNLLKRNVTKTKMSYKDLVIDSDLRVIKINDNIIETTYKEFELLWYLMKNSNRVVPREELFNHLWGYDFVGESRTLDVHINSLRKKLKSPYGEYIIVVRGVGYRFHGEEN